MSKKIKQNQSFNSDDTQVWVKGIKVLIILSLVFIAFYLITYFKLNTKSNVPETEPSIQYLNILAGDVLTASDKPYNVLDLFENDKNASLYETYLSKLGNYYIVDMSSGFNRQYISEEQNITGKDPVKFRYKETTLLSIENHEVKSFYSGSESILNELKG